MKEQEGGNVARETTEDARPGAIILGSGQRREGGDAAWHVGRRLARKAHQRPSFEEC